MKMKLAIPSTHKHYESDKYVFTFQKKDSNIVDSIITFISTKNAKEQTIAQKQQQHPPTQTGSKSTTTTETTTTSGVRKLSDILITSLDWQTLLKYCSVESFKSNDVILAEREVRNQLMQVEHGRVRVEVCFIYFLSLYQLSLYLFLVVFILYQLSLYLFLVVFHLVPTFYLFISCRFYLVPTFS